MTKQISNDDFPTAQISVNDPRCRAAIVETLHDLGWSVVEQPTGLHLIQEMSGLILGDQQSLSPGLIVADAAARGCSGLSIAQGLCDLGAEVPVVVVASAQQSREGTRGRTWRVVRPDNAAQTVKRLARSRRRRRNQQCAPQLASA